MERSVSIGQRGELRARIGVSQTAEELGSPAQSLPTLELRRPALEGHFQFGYQPDEVRRFEIGTGFHRSSTHVAQTSVPADLLSVDWFVKPLQ